jgi:hypothetical protein
VESRDVGTQVDSNLLPIDTLQDIHLGLREDLELTALKASAKNHEALKTQLWRIYSALVPRINEVERGVNEMLRDTRTRCEEELQRAVAELEEHYQQYNEHAIQQHQKDLEVDLQQTEHLLKKMKGKSQKAQEEQEIYILKVAKLSMLLSKHNLIRPNELLRKEMDMAEDIVGNYTKQIAELSEQINKLRIRVNAGKLGRDSGERNPPLDPKVLLLSQSDSSDKPKVHKSMQGNTISSESKTIVSIQEDTEIDLKFVLSDPRILLLQRTHTEKLQEIRKKREKQANLWMNRINSLLRLQNPKVVEKIMRRQQRILTYAERIVESTKVPTIELVQYH